MVPWLHSTLSDQAGCCKWPASRSDPGQQTKDLDCLLHLPKWSEPYIRLSLAIWNPTASQDTSWTIFQQSTRKVGLELSSESTNALSITWAHRLAQVGNQENTWSSRGILGRRAVALSSWILLPFKTSLWEHSMELVRVHGRCTACQIGLMSQNYSLSFVSKWTLATPRRSLKTNKSEDEPTLLTVCFTEVLEVLPYSPLQDRAKRRRCSQN